MARINLLPWREQLREQRKQQFIATLIGVLLAGAALVFLADQVFGRMIEQQQARNAYIRQEIAALDARIKEISELRKKRQELIDRTKVIQDLQGNRPILSRIFDQLVRTIPAGVYFSSVKMTGKNIAIEGVPAPVKRISRLRRSHHACEWRRGPSRGEGKRRDEPEGRGAELRRAEVRGRQTRPSDRAKRGGARPWAGNTR